MIHCSSRMKASAASTATSRTIGITSSAWKNSTKEYASSEKGPERAERETVKSASRSSSPKYRMIRSRYRGIRAQLMRPRSASESTHLMKRFGV
jgi:hypothetical protein